MRGRSFPYVYCVNRNPELAVSVTILFTGNCAHPPPTQKKNLTWVRIENFQVKKFPEHFLLFIFSVIPNVLEIE